MYVSTLLRWSSQRWNAHHKISLRMFVESYTPRTWRTQPLHICPPEPFSTSDPLTKECLNWIFLISSLNFSFWSEREGSEERYGVEWRAGWDTETRTIHTGYWSLVAALNRGGSPHTLVPPWTRDDRLAVMQLWKKTFRSPIRRFTRPRCSVQTR